MFDVDRTDGKSERSLLDFDFVHFAQQTPEPSTRREGWETQGPSEQWQRLIQEATRRRRHCRAAHRQPPARHLGPNDQAELRLSDAHDVKRAKAGFSTANLPKTPAAAGLQGLERQQALHVPVCVRHNCERFWDRCSNNCTSHEHSDYTASGYTAKTIRTSLSSNTKNIIRHKQHKKIENSAKLGTPKN